MKKRSKLSAAFLTLQRMKHKFKSSNHRLPDAERQQQSVGPVMWRAEQQ